MSKADQLAHDVIAHQVIVVDIYCRVSTDPQDSNSSFPEQEASCREHIEKVRSETGLNIVVGMVHTETYTGYLYRERKKLALMRERCRTGKIQGVVFRTLDRLSRKQEHVAILIEEMEHYGIQIYCAKEKIDDTPVGKIVRMVLAFMAEMEREKIMDRTFAGRIRKAENREIQVIANGKAPYWCEWVINEKGEKVDLVLDEEKAKVIEFMAESFDNGMPISQISKQLEQNGVKTPEGKDEWQVSAVRRYLKDPRIAGLGGNCFSRHEGKKPMQEVSYPDGTYPAVISVERFERIQRRLEANRQDSARNSKHHEEYLLRAGFVKCECGRAMIGTNDGKNSQGTRWVYQCGDPRCGRRVNSKKLDEIIWDRLKELADQTELVAKAVELATSSNVVLSEVTSIERSLASWQKKVNNYMDDLEDPDLAGETRAAIRKAYNDSQIMVSRLEGERAMLAVKMVDVEKAKQEAKKIMQWCSTVKEAREELSYQEKRDYMRLLGLVVIVQEKSGYGEIAYKLEAALPELRAILQMPITQDERSKGHAPQNSSDTTGIRLEHTSQYPRQSQGESGECRAFAGPGSRDGSAVR